MRSLEGRLMFRMTLTDLRLGRITSVVSFVGEGKRNKD